MSLPSELRVLCFQLSSIAVSDLPRLIPTLLRHVLRCQIPLSSPAGSAGKADASASASAVLVHKLKTQLSTLLNGKSSEGRFVGVVLIKAVVEVGGWEVLQGSEAWVRGLLALLGVRNIIDCLVFKIHLTDALIEARFCGNQRVVHYGPHEDLLYDPWLSDAGPGDHNTSLADVHYVLPEPGVFQVILKAWHY